VFTARRATYWLRARNDHAEPVLLTLAWCHGSRVRRTAPTIPGHRTYTTFAGQPLGSAHGVSIELLDAAGTALHTDQVSFASSAAP